MGLESCLIPSVLCHPPPPPTLFFVFSFMENFQELVIFFGGNIWKRMKNQGKMLGG
jgi:hypothetical protein